MNFQDALVKVIFQGIDKMSGPMKGIDRQMATIEGRYKRLQQMGGGMSRLGSRMLTFGGLGGGLGLGIMVKEAADAESALAQLGNIANLSESQTKAMGSSVLALSGKVGQTQMELLGGLQTLMGAGLSSGEAMASMARLGKVATAYGADVNEAARTAFAAYSNLKVPVGQVAKLFDVLAQAGKEGNFELKDMAKELPSIAASAQMLGVSGISGASQIGAALQIAKRGAGDPAEAANNFQNFLMKIDGPETRAKFKKMGVNWSAEMKKFKASDDIFEAVGVRLNELQKKGLNIGDVFQDMQVRKFLNSFLRDVDDYKKIRDNAFNASGVVDKDFVRVSKTFNQALKGLKNSFTALMMPKLMPWIEKITGFFNRLAQNPQAFENLLSIGKGFIAAAVGMKILGGAMSIMGSPFVTQGLMSGAFARSIQGVTGVMGPLAAGLPGLVAAMGPLMFPMLVIAAAGLLVYKHWDQVGPVFKNVAEQAGGLTKQLGDLGLSPFFGKSATVADDAAGWRGWGTVIEYAGHALEGLIYGLRTLAAIMQAARGFGGSMLEGVLDFDKKILTGDIKGAFKGIPTAFKKGGDAAVAPFRPLAGGTTLTKMGGFGGEDGPGTGPAFETTTQRRLRAFHEGSGGVMKASDIRKAQGVTKREAPVVTGGINITINGKTDEEEIVKQVRKAFRDAQRRSFRTGPDTMAMQGAH